MMALCFISGTARLLALTQHNRGAPFRAMREGTMRNAMTGATILLMMAASAAFGQQFPIYDTNSFCNGVVDENSKIICPTMEETARSDVEAKWTQLKSDVRQRCIESNAKSQSYFSLAACVDIALAPPPKPRPPGQPGEKRNNRTPSD